MQIEFSRCKPGARHAHYWALKVIDTPAMATVSDYPPATTPRAIAARGWVPVPGREELITAARLHLDVWWQTSAKSKSGSFVRLPRWPAYDAEEFRALLLFLLPIAPENAIQALGDAEPDQLASLSPADLVPILQSSSPAYRLAGIRAAGRIASGRGIPTSE